MRKAADMKLNHSGPESDKPLSAAQISRGLLEKFSSFCGRKRVRYPAVVVGAALLYNRINAEHHGDPSENQTRAPTAGLFVMSGPDGERGVPVLTKNIRRSLETLAQIDPVVRKFLKAGRGLEVLPARAWQHRASLDCVIDEGGNIEINGRSLSKLGSSEFDDREASGFVSLRVVPVISAMLWQEELAERLRRADLSPGLLCTAEFAGSVLAWESAARAYLYDCSDVELKKSALKFDLASDWVPGWHGQLNAYSPIELTRLLNQSFRVASVAEISTRRLSREKKFTAQELWLTIRDRINFAGEVTPIRISAPVKETMEKYQNEALAFARRVQRHGLNDRLNIMESSLTDSSLTVLPQTDAGDGELDQSFCRFLGGSLGCCEAQEESEKLLSILERTIDRFEKTVEITIRDGDTWRALNLAGPILSAVRALKVESAERKGYELRITECLRSLYDAHSDFESFQVIKDSSLFSNHELQKCEKRLCIETPAPEDYLPPRVAPALAGLTAEERGWLGYLLRDGINFPSHALHRNLKYSYPQHYRNLFETEWFLSLTVSAQSAIFREFASVGRGAPRNRIGILDPIDSRVVSPFNILQEVLELRILSLELPPRLSSLICEAYCLMPQHHRQNLLSQRAGTESSIGKQILFYLGDPSKNNGPFARALKVATSGNKKYAGLGADQLFDLLAGKGASPLHWAGNVTVLAASQSHQLAWMGIYGDRMLDALSPTRTMVDAHRIVVKEMEGFNIPVSSIGAKLTDFAQGVLDGNWNGNMRPGVYYQTPVERIGKIAPQDGPRAALILYGENRLSDLWMRFDIEANRWAKRLEETYGSVTSIRRVQSTQQFENAISWLEKSTGGGSAAVILIGHGSSYDAGSGWNQGVPYPVAVNEIGVVSLFGYHVAEKELKYKINTRIAPAASTVTLVVTACHSGAFTDEGRAGPQGADLAQ